MQPSIYTPQSSYYPSYIPLTLYTPQSLIYSTQSLYVLPLLIYCLYMLSCFMFLLCWFDKPTADDVVCWLMTMEKVENKNSFWYFLFLYIWKLENFWYFSGIFCFKMFGFQFFECAMNYFRNRWKFWKLWVINGLFLKRTTFWLADKWQAKRKKKFKF